MAAINRYYTDRKKNTTQTSPQMLAVIQKNILKRSKMPKKSISW